MSKPLTEENAELVIKQANLIRKNTGKPELTEAEVTNLKTFLMTEQRDTAVKQSGNKLLKQAREKLTDTLKFDPDALNRLKDLIPDEINQARSKIEKTKKLAGRSLWNLFKFSKIKSARRELQEMQKYQSNASLEASNTASRNKYTPVSKRKGLGGRSFWHLGHKLFASFNFGPHADRHNVSKDPVLYFVNQVKSLTCPTKDGMLDGAMFIPVNSGITNRFDRETNPPKPTDKVVLAFTGNFDPARTQIGYFADEYLKEGIPVFSFDYRGYGNSRSGKMDKNGTFKVTGTHLSEESIYQDARAMYDYVLSLGFKPSQIILHGFSMGGAAASKLAADIAEEAALEKGGKEENRLGGLVLHSPMPNNQYCGTEALVNEGGLPRWLSNIGAALHKWAVGNFNTKKHMERLYKADPNLPVHFVGNTGEDWLSPAHTGIAENPGAPFPNQSMTISNADNHCVPLSFENDRDPGIEELCKKGRSAVLNTALNKTKNIQQMLP